MITIQSNIMKTKIALILLTFVILNTNVFSQVKVSGRLLDEKAVPVEFANIALKSLDKFQGTVSDDQGYFEVLVYPGNYNLKISAIGYDSYEKEIVIEKNDVHLSEIQMAESSVEIGEVVVKADRVVRKADRFIVNLMNDPTVFGKSGTDILNQSPGVFIQERDGAISINGKTGTKVYINERPLHETGTDLVRYLQTLKAEDIMRIEVVPMAGADYDANIQGGIIKITLKRLRNDGMNGSVGSSYAFAPNEDFSFFRPSFNMNYQNNRLSLYTSLNYEDARTIEHVYEEVNTLSMNRQANSIFDFPMKTHTGRVRFGGIYDLSDKQSIGLEGYYSRSSRKNSSNGILTETINGDHTDITSLFNGKNITDNYSASANYILKLDSVGSLFKVLLDYHHNESDDNQHYNSEYRGYMNYDTIYQSHMNTQNDLYAVSADLALQLNDYTSLSTGIKYVRNEMNTETLFEYQKGNNWNILEPYSNMGVFSEDIVALFASFSSRIKNLSYSIGLRGEYTSNSPWSDKSDKTKDQHYFELFPSVNIMLPFGKDSKHSVVVNYNRKITRPAFDYLNPYRLPASEYLYIEGNPNLEAVMPNDYSISLRLFNRFNITTGITDTKKSFETVIITDPTTPDILVQRTENIGRNTNYYLSMNTSLKPLEWWQINVNLFGIRNKLDIFDRKRSINTFNAYMGWMFSLPPNYMIDLNGQYTSPFFRGNMKMEVEQPQINISLRKQFFDKRLNTSIFIYNILDKGVSLGKTKENDYQRNIDVRFYYRHFGLSLSYNFNVGKNVKVKNVETGAAEEKARLRN